jgi:malonyl CoA-acyl carrier protein transacylase/NAD(P)-dependent dehydrogenase (short-subunit alcohol dehydrogenase family)/acyl carrier protein
MHSFALQQLTFRARDARDLLARVDACLRGECAQQQVGPAALCIVARDSDEARTLLEEAAATLRRGQLPNRVGLRATLEGLGAEALVGMFPGQGSQGKDMLGSLARAHEPFAAMRRALDGEFAPVEGRSIEAWIAQASQEELTRTDVAQPALGLTSYALATWLAELGVRPPRLVGHSYGELVALACAGAFSERALARLSTLRGELMAKAGRAAQGGMLAIRGPYHVTERLVRGHDGLWLANENAPEQTVVAGELSALDALEQRARGERVATERLRTACAFHTPLMAPAAQAFAEALAELEVEAPARAKVWANETAEPYHGSAQAIRDGLARQIVSPVRFASSIEAIYRDGGRIFLELGAGKVLRDLVTRTLGTRAHLALSLDPGPADAALHVADVLAQLTIHGLDLSVPRVTMAAAENMRVEAPRARVREAFFAANQSALEAFFAQQRLLLERLPAASDELVRAVMETNRSVLSEYLSAQERALGGDARAVREPAALATSAPQALPTDDLATRILTWLRRAIAELTGFAVEAVKPTSELENELGLDSITIVEIYTRLVEAFPGLAGLGAEVRKARTVEDAVTRMLEAVAGREGTLPSAESAAASERTESAQQHEAAEPGAQLALIASALIHSLEGTASPELALDADFAADLGIDVFTRRDLVRRLLERFPELQVAGRELVFAATPRELLALCQGILGQGERDVVQRYVQTRVQLTPDARRPIYERVIVAGPAGRCRALCVEALTHAGTQLDVLDVADRKLTLRGRSLLADDASRLAELAPLLRCDLLLLVTPEDELAPDALSGLCATLFALAKALDRAGAPRRLALAGTGSVAHDAVAGLLRALAHEWKDSSIRAARIESALGLESVERALQILLSGCSQLDLFVEDARVAQGKLELEPLPQSTPGSFPLALGAHVLLTGGGDGITARVAELLAERAGARISAIGRTPWPEAYPYPEARSDAELRAVLRRELEKRAHRPDGKGLARELAQRFARVARQRALLNTKTRIESLGGSFCYHAADVRDRQALASAVAELKVAHGPVHGLVHGAGVIEDARLAHKSTASFCRVLETKLTSALHLEELLREEPLSFAFLFSSLTAFTGNVGQTDYVAANQALSAVAARWAAGVSYPVRALAWSVWHESGLAPGWARALIAQGRFTGISDAQGGELFTRELAHGRCEHSAVLLAPPSAIRFVERGGVEQESEAHG